MSILYVATPVQKAVFEEVIKSEITSTKGFWFNMRPSGHSNFWTNVTVEVAKPGQTLGASGFNVPRNYNFLNPGFFSTTQNKLMEAAQKVSPTITVNQLKRELTSLSQIVGARLTEVNGVAIKLQRGRKPFASTAKLSLKNGATKRAVANIVDEEPTVVAA